MNKQVKVLMIDDNAQIISQAENYFSSHAVINLSLKACTGKEGLDLILNNQNDYDVVIIDLIMPNKDGLSIIGEMRKKNINKKVIAISSYKSDYILSKLNDYNVDYFMLKPYNFDDLEKIVMETNLDNNIVTKAENELQMSITKLLHSLGIPSHIRGYQYIKESICLMFKNPDLIGQITKNIYPEIALKFDTTSSRVERAIRHAIEISWNRGDYDLMEDIFGHSVDYDRAKPTNSEFIVTIADKLRMDLNKVNI